MADFFIYILKTVGLNGVNRGVKEGQEVKVSDNVNVVQKDNVTNSKVSITLKEILNVYTI